MPRMRYRLSVASVTVLIFTTLLAACGRDVDEAGPSIPVHGSYVLDPESMERVSSDATFHARLDLFEGDVEDEGRFTLDWSADGGNTTQRLRGTWRRADNVVVTTVRHEDDKPVAEPRAQRWRVEDGALRLDVLGLVLKKQAR